MKDRLFSKKTDSRFHSIFEKCQNAGKLSLNVGVTEKLIVHGEFDALDLFNRMNIKLNVHLTA